MAEADTEHGTSASTSCASASCTRRIQGSWSAIRAGEPVTITPETSFGWGSKVRISVTSTTDHAPRHAAPVLARIMSANEPARLAA